MGLFFQCCGIMSINPMSYITQTMLWVVSLGDRVLDYGTGSGVLAICVACLAQSHIV